MNQSKTDLGIVNESQFLRFGITRCLAALEASCSAGGRIIPIWSMKNNGEPMTDLEIEQEIGLGRLRERLRMRGSFRFGGYSAVAIAVIAYWVVLFAHAVS